MISILNILTRRFKSADDRAKAEFRKRAKELGYAIYRPAQEREIVIMYKDIYVYSFDGATTPEESVLGLIAEDMELRGL